MEVTPAWRQMRQEVTTTRHICLSTVFGATTVDGLFDYNRRTFLLSFHTVPPQLVPFTFGDEASNSGDSQAIQCMAMKGDLPIEISWWLNEKPIEVASGISISKVSPRLSSLSIDSISDKHRGDFKCVARNKGGHAEYATELKVNGT